jgi:hypothetical protein
MEAGYLAAGRWDRKFRRYWGDADPEVLEAEVPVREQEPVRVLVLVLVREQEEVLRCEDERV